jgi:putative transposase
MLRLETSDNDKALLLETMKRYNEACNFVADKAFSPRLSNRHKLQKEVYTQVRGRFGLTAQLQLG